MCPNHFFLYYSFPGATNETLLQKFNTVHKDNKFYIKPQKREGAFIVIHYAGKVKYQVTDMREKNLDLMRQDIVGVLKNSSMAFVRELVGADPVAVFRWAIVRAFFRAYFAFHEAGRKHRQGRVDGNKNNIQQRYQRNHVPNENIIRFVSGLCACAKWSVWRVNRLSGCSKNFFLCCITIDDFIVVFGSIAIS